MFFEWFDEEKEIRLLVTRNKWTLELTPLQQARTYALACGFKFAHNL